MQTKEINKELTKLIVPEELRQKMGVPENEIFGIERIADDTVQLTSLGIDENYQKAEIPKDLAEKLEHIGIKKDYAHVIRTDNDYTMLILKLPKENAEAV